MKPFFNRNQSIAKVGTSTKKMLPKQLGRFLWVLMGLFLVLLVQIVFVRYTASLNAIESTPKGTSQDLSAPPIQPIERTPKQIPKKLPPTQPLEERNQPNQEVFPFSKPRQSDNVSDKDQPKCEKTEKLYEICLQKRELDELRNDTDLSRLKIIAENLASIIRSNEEGISNNKKAVDNNNKEIIDVDRQLEKEKNPEKKSDIQQNKNELLRKKNELLRKKNELLRIKSYALGFLGEAYEKTKQWDKAQNLTKNALVIAESLSDNGLAYQWQWQLGRVYRDREKTAFKQEETDIKQSIIYYGLAVDVLDKIRSDIASVSSGDKFNFFDEVEPIYRDYVSLLLKEYVRLSKSEVDQQDNLKEARRVISSLQSSELASFLGEPCPINRPEFLDNVVNTKDQSAALLYPIVLEDRVAVILKLPKQERLYYYDSSTASSNSGKSFNQVVREFQIALEEAYTFKVVKVLSSQVYTWLIKGAEKYLDSYAQTHSQPIETLVFVLDSPLRNIPMSALYDGKQYLIEKYAVAIAPRLELPNLRPLQKRRLSVLAAGLTKSSDGKFPELKYVPDEIKSIESTGVRVKKLIDENFNKTEFNDEINANSYQIIHLATHGEFSSKPGQTFILSSKGKINADQLEELFIARNENRLDTIEMLVLNACETATGDKRATLGISGIAVKAGVRSAIASLWTLNDKFSVEFSRQLYQQLQQPRLSKAEALQKVQQAILKNPQYEHPRYWAPYLLVGNWL